VGAAYLAAEGFVADLIAELGPEAVLEVRDRLVLAAGPARRLAWAQNVWFEPVVLPFESIAGAAQALRALQRNWALWPTGHYRRASLIQERLPHVSAKPLEFPAPAPVAPLGSWTLLDANTLLAAGRCSSRFRHGEARFVENRTAPPSRAYLKLWEALTLLGDRPGPGSRCLDLGASPGGWSWVLAQLGAQVLAVDKAPLDPAVAALPGVTVRTASAFAVTPAEIGPVDWLTCDVICYPERLLRLVETWLGAGFAGTMVCSVKFQGATDHALAARLAAIPGSRLLHLFHNKHELTWIHQPRCQTA
jgi:23S rRNA (cytidine2498-2'-O)-methyltransferase